MSKCNLLITARARVIEWCVKRRGEHHEMSALYGMCVCVGVCVGVCV